MSGRFHAIVVGARCAGAATAMLLARRGFDVLLLDRAHFPSDVVSTHLVQPRGVAALARWGLLEPLLATGCPPIPTYAFDIDGLVIAGAPGKADSPFACCPRRTVLDKLLVDAATRAGAEVRQGFTADALLVEDDCVVGIRGHSQDGRVSEARATVVIGADGRRSFVGNSVRAAHYDEKPAALHTYYAYWRGVDLKRVEICVRHRCLLAAAPTHDGLAIVAGSWPRSGGSPGLQAIEAAYAECLRIDADLAKRVRGGERVAPLAGTAIPNFFRRAYGPGWVLAGDARFTKDPITAQGITDAFDDAEACVTALQSVFEGRRPFAAAMAEYQQRRDEEVRLMYELTCQSALLEPPPPETRFLLSAIRTSQEAMDGFVQMNAGTLSRAEFFSPQNIAAIMSASVRMAG
jgi:2-polyprenyl-6-methoxyphenol hydroxylase-like FAD-dependent oxidoreductase